MIRLYYKLKYWLRRRQHIHKWRPGMSSFGPCKSCEDCGLVVQLSNSEFYAQFGRLPLKPL